MVALREAIFRFGSSKPCIIVHDFDRKRLQHTWRVEGKVDTPPQEISLRLGDTLDNWRGVLDHLAWELVIANNEAPSRFTAFPICSDFDTESVQRNVTGMDALVVAKIKDLQPHKGANRHSTNHLLGLLNRLGNVEKHRHFNLIAVSVDRAAFSVEEASLSEAFIHEGPIEDGTILAVAKGQVDVNFIPAFGVAFGKGGYAPGENVDELVLRIELAVQDVLFELAWFALSP